MLKFITLPNRTKPGLIDLKWQTPVKFFLLFWTNLVISRTVLHNIPCWFWKEITIYSATIISQWPTVKFCLYLTWEIPTRVSMVSSIKYLPATGVSVPILNELTHVIDMGFIRWSLYETIWSKHIIVLCFVSIESNHERKITKRKKQTSPIVYTISKLQTTTTFIYPSGVLIKIPFSILTDHFTNGTPLVTFVTQRNAYMTSDERFLHCFGVIHLHWCCNKMAFSGNSQWVAFMEIRFCTFIWNSSPP